jgi:hypothetical protein
MTKLVVAFCSYVNGPVIEAAAGTGRHQRVLSGCTVCGMFGHDKDEMKPSV